MTTEALSGLILILGSPNDDNGNLSEMGVGRVQLGFQKYNELKASGWKFLLTGGFGDHFNSTALPNAYYAKQLLIAQGIPETHIVDFALSRNTVDDALQAKPIVEKYHCKSLIVVSSDFHIPRVEFIFRKVFPDCVLNFEGAKYLDSRTLEERERLLEHEERELESLRERGESIVGGVFSLNS